MERSMRMLEHKLADGEVIYGKNRSNSVRSVD